MQKEIRIYDLKTLELKKADKKVQEFIKDFYDWRACSLNNLKKLIKATKQKIK